MSDKKRDLNLDLIRSVALVAVFIMHYYDNSGFYTVTMDSWDDFVMAMVRLLFATCVPLFLMLSGYLCYKKPLSKDYYLGVLRVVELYVLCGLACMLFEHFYLGEQYSLKNVISRIINFEACGYGWYVLLYMGLFIMQPFLNLMYNGCATKAQKLVLIASFFVLSCLPSLVNNYVHLYSLWWSKLYPLTYYFTGAFLCQYGKGKKPWKYALALLIALVAFAGYNQFYFGGDALNYDGVHYDHYQIFVLSVLLFLWINNLNLSHWRRPIQAVVQWVSTLSFAAYLCSWISDGVIYRMFVPNYPVAEDRYIWILVWVPMTAVASLLMAQVIHWIYNPLDRFLRSKISRLIGE